MSKRRFHPDWIKSGEAIGAAFFCNDIILAWH